MDFKNKRKLTSMTPQKLNFNLFFLGIYLISAQTLACDFCMLGQGISPYLTASGRGLTASVDLTNSDQIYNKTSAIESHGKKESWLLETLTGFMALTPDFTIFAALPYAQKTNIDFDSTSNSNPGTLSSGLGDITLSGRYTLVQKHSLETTFLTGLLFGIKIPTGRTDLKDNSGSKLDRHSMPGTGSYDEILGVSSAYSSAQGLQVTGDLVYNFSGKGKWDNHAHQYGDSINLSLKAFYQISNLERKDQSYFLFTGPAFQITGKEHGSQTDSGYQDDLINDSTGGQVGFWDLGVYAVFNPSVVINISYGKAIYHNLNYSTDFDADPAENDRMKSSVTFLF